MRRIIMFNWVSADGTSRHRWKLGLGHSGRRTSKAAAEAISSLDKIKKSS